MCALEKTQTWEFSWISTNSTSIQQSVGTFWWKHAALRGETKLQHFLSMKNDDKANHNLSISAFFAKKIASSPIHHLPYHHTQIFGYDQPLESTFGVSTFQIVLIQAAQLRADVSTLLEQGLASMGDCIPLGSLLAIPDVGKDVPVAVAPSKTRDVALILSPQRLDRVVAG